MPILKLKGNSIGKVYGVLFDKDGTLSNSELYLKDLSMLRIKAALSIFKDRYPNIKKYSELDKLLRKAYGIKPYGIDPAGTIAIGSRSENIYSTATILSILGATWPDALEISTQIFDIADNEHRNEKSYIQERLILDGAKSFLNELKNAGVKCGLISNDSESGIRQFIKANQLEEIFPYIWSANNVPAKPDPMALHNLCSLAQLCPNECALIGDADSDLKMARQAGVKLAIGYLAGWSMTPTLSNHHHLINHWNELSIE